MINRLLLIAVAMVALTICATHKSRAIDANNLPAPFDIVMVAGADYELMLNVVSPFGGALDLSGNSYAAQFRSAPYPSGSLFASFSAAKYNNISTVPTQYRYSSPKQYAFKPFSSAALQCQAFVRYSSPDGVTYSIQPSGWCYGPYSTASGWVYSNSSSWTNYGITSRPFIRSGHIQLTLPAVTTKSLSGKTGLWDLVQVNTLGKIRYLMGGKAMVRPAVTVLP